MGAFRILAVALTCPALAGCPAPKPARASLPPFEVRPAAVSPAAEPSPDVVLAGSFLFYEDFEAGPGTRSSWRTSGGASAGWFRLNAPACGGAFVMLYGMKGQAPFFPASDDAFLESTRPLDLRAARRPHLTYTVMARAEPPGSLVLQPEIRPEGGAWTAVGSPAPARYRLAFTRFADLTPYAGARVALRFRLRASRSAAPTKGFYLDDVQVIEPQAR